MGVFKHSDFGVPNPSHGSFLITPITTVSSKIDSAWTASGGFPRISFGDLPVLERTPHKKDRPAEVPYRDTHGEKGGLAKRWGCT